MQSQKNREFLTDVCMGSYEKRKGKESMKQKNRRVLLVEDEEIMALYIQEGLSRLKDVESKWISRGEDAWLAVEAFGPDLILMDIHLGQGMNGIETAHYICQERMIPILFVSGLCDSTTLQEARQVRPVGYLMKPFDYSGLKASVEMGLSWSSGFMEIPVPHATHKKSAIITDDVEHSETSVICMCSSCKSIRDMKGRWRRLERFLNQKYNLVFSHGICPDCFQDMYPETPEEVKQL